MPSSVRWSGRKDPARARPLSQTVTLGATWSSGGEGQAAGSFEVSVGRASLPRAESRYFTRYLLSPTKAGENSRIAKAPQRRSTCRYCRLLCPGRCVCSSSAQMCWARRASRLELRVTHRRRALEGSRSLPTSPAERFAGAGWLCLSIHLNECKICCCKSDRVGVQPIRSRARSAVPIKRAARPSDAGHFARGCSYQSPVLWRQ
jgi:hypothetical protein